MYAVIESEHILASRLAHGTMIAALYGNSGTDIDAGNKQVHKMFVSSLESIPYIKPEGGGRRCKASLEALAEQWHRMNGLEYPGGK